MSRGAPTSPSEGAGFFSSLIGRAARSVVEHALNSTANATATTDGPVQPSRSFFDLGFGRSDSTDGITDVPQIVEYSGKTANNEIATIYPIALRAGSLILHGPRKFPEDQSTSNYPLFNIILHATNASGSVERMYSLFRAELEDEATRIFVIYNQIFPDLVKASNTPLDKQTLEKILKISSKYESYFGVHVAAALDMVDQLKSPVLREKFVEQEGKFLHTPLQVACVHAKLEAFRTIMTDERLFLRVFDLTDIKGNTVVHLAAECKDKAVGASILKSFKQRLQSLSGAERANSSRIILNQFLTLNNEGLAPIHLACRNLNQEAVEELSTVNAIQTSTNLMSSPTMNSPTMNMLDIKAAANGHTPLHFVTTNPAILTKLLESGSDPNISDNDGLTPLHKAVQSDNLKSTLQLLSHKAYPNFTATFDTYINATPLHIAASIGAIDCMKALIVFGADLEIKDGNGHSPRHIIASVYSGNTGTKQEALFVFAAAGAKRCGLNVSGGCSEGCKAGGKIDGKKPDTWRIHRDGTSPPAGVSSNAGLLVHEAMRGLSIIKESFEGGMQEKTDQAGRGPVIGGRLLSLDGGGIRGLVLTQMLFFIENEFSNISGGGAPIISYFDWVAGTSTGGILALALASGKSALETQSLYMKLKDKVFTGERPYSATRMEEFLKREFGPDRKMNSIQKPRVMIMTSLANRRPPDLYIFRNYISPGCLLGDPEEFAQYPDDTYIWETAKVTGAAPSYFTLDNELFIDGGLISNNPTLDALAELVQFKAVMMGSQQNVNGQRSNNWKLPSMVLSLGTGIPPPEASSTTNLDIGWPSGVFDAIRNVPRLSQLINLLVDQATQSEGQVVERSRAWCTSIGVPYFRFSPEMGSNIGLDEKSDEVLVNLMWETWCYMVGNRDSIKEIYERLLETDISRTAEAMDTK